MILVMKRRWADLCTSKTTTGGFSMILIVETYRVWRTTMATHHAKHGIVFAKLALSADYVGSAGACGMSLMGHPCSRNVSVAPMRVARKSGTTVSGSRLSSPLANHFLPPETPPVSRGRARSLYRVIEGLFIMWVVVKNYGLFLHPNYNTAPNSCGWLSNYGPYLGTLNIRCRILIGIPKRDHDFDNHPCIVFNARPKFLAPWTEVPKDTFPLNPKP